MLQHLTYYHVQDSTVKKEANEKDMINGSFDGADNDIIKPEKENNHNMTTSTTQSRNTTDDDVNCNSNNFFNEWEDGNWCWERDYDKFQVVSLSTVPTTSGNSKITQPTNDIAPPSTSDQNNNLSVHMDNVMDKTTKKNVHRIHKRRTRVFPNDKECAPQGEGVGASGGTQGVGDGSSRNVSRREMCRNAF